MARDDPTIYMRLPAELKARLDAAAHENRRSVTAEVTARLQASFDAPFSAEAVAALKGMIDEAVRRELAAVDQLPKAAAKSGARMSSKDAPGSHQ